MKNTTLLILLSLFIISCDEDNPVSGSIEVDVDWVLVKTSNFYEDYISQSCESESSVDVQVDIDVDEQSDECDDSGPYESSNTGYFFYYTSSSNVTHNMIPWLFDSFGSSFGVTLDVDGPETYHNLIINYEDEVFSYNISDSFLGGESNSEMSDCFPPDCGSYSIRDSTEPIQRIIYNTELNYFTLFGPNGFHGTGLNSSSPNELIDYR